MAVQMYSSSHFRAVQSPVYQPDGGASEAQGGGSAKAAVAGGETPAGSGASASSLPAACR